MAVAGSQVEKAADRQCAYLVYLLAMHLPLLTYHDLLFLKYEYSVMGRWYLWSLDGLSAVESALGFCGNLMVSRVST